MGRYLGGNVPIGFSVTVDGHLETNGSREALLKRILELKKKGLSLRAIASKLQDRGYRISHTGVDRTLKSVGYYSAKRAAASARADGAEMMD